MAIKEFICPNCNAPIQFDSNTQKMVCEYCGTELDVETVEEYTNSLKEDFEEKTEWKFDEIESFGEDDIKKLRKYTCENCGGEIIGDETTAATTCPYCNNNVVIEEQLSDLLRPDLIIPFKFDHKQAKEALAKHYMKKPLLPKTFKDDNHLEEIKGIYVPMWLYDSKAYGNIRFRGTRTRHYSDSKYDYTETKYYAIVRKGNMAFEAIPADGSKKMPDEFIESIEPFDIGEAVDFKTAYLAGYFADKYDVTADENKEHVNERIKNSVVNTLSGTVIGFDSLLPESVRFSLEDNNVSYALYPVWLLNTVWNDKKYQFIMNGQTGKVAGDLPIDKGLAVKYFFMIFMIVAAIIIAFGLITYLM